MVMQQLARTVAPGQTATGVLTINNPGEIGTRYAVEISTGVAVPLVGFTQESRVLRQTGVVQPGQSTTVRIPISLPPGISEGGKELRVRVGEAGSQGELTNVLDEQVFSGLLVVRAPAAPPPVEAIPLPEEVPKVVPTLGFGDVDIGLASASPSTVQPGGQVMVQVPLTNVGPVAASLRVQGFIIDSAGASVVQLPLETVTPSVNQTSLRAYDVMLPASFPAGDYGLSVSIFDDLTGTLLATRSFSRLFSVEEAPLGPGVLIPVEEEPVVTEAALPTPAQLFPVAEEPVTEEVEPVAEMLPPGAVFFPAEEEAPLEAEPGGAILFAPTAPTAAPQLGDVIMGLVSASPDRVVRDGAIVAVVFPLTNLLGRSLTTRIQVTLIDPRGQEGRFAVISAAGVVLPAGSTSFTGQIDTTGLPSGRSLGRTTDAYGVRIVIRDEPSGVVVLDATRGDIFRVLEPEPVSAATLGAAL